MKRTTFIITTVICLVIVISGFVAAILHQILIGLILIAISGIASYLISKQAKKEDWFGKPIK